MQIRSLKSFADYAAYVAAKAAETKLPVFASVRRGSPKLSQHQLGQDKRVSAFRPGVRCGTQLLR
jgi:hypothetical protein